MDEDQIRVAVVCGATGLTGKYLLNELLNSDCFEKVIAVVRSEFVLSHPKLELVKVNFNNLADFADKIKGTDYFSTLGTTLKKAGSKEEFFKTDVELVFEFAKIAKKNHAKNFYLLSSVGADPNSKNYYLKVKGILENRVQELNFESLHIFRPSLLLGHRNESRPAEKIAQVLLPFLSFLLVGKFRKYKPIASKILAKAICKVAELKVESAIHHYDDIYKIHSSIF